MKSGLPLTLLLLAAFLLSCLAANTGDSDRITSTLNSPSVPIGGPIIITWSIVPDGTVLPSFRSATGTAPPSNLVARFDALHNVPSPLRDPDDYTNRPWFPSFSNSFNNYARKSGMTYLYLHDTDSTSSFGSGPLAGQRGDIRIGGASLTGVLGYNRFPAQGSDMVLNTAGSTFANLASLQLIITHEHAHGLGFDHVLVDGNAARSVVSGSGGNVNGPQFDDLLQLHRKYGDKYEKSPGNDSQGNAIDLGTLVEGSPIMIGEDADDLIIQAAQEDFVSIDHTTDEDFYSFTLTETADVTIELTPRGPNYSYQIGATTFTLDAASESDLVFKLYNSSGILLLTQDNTSAGIVEVALAENLSAGSYAIAVSGKNSRSQMYALTVVQGELDSDNDGLPNNAEIAGDADGDGIDNLLDPDADGDGTQDGPEVAAGRLPYDVRDMAFEFEVDGDTESWSGNNLTAPLAAAGGLASGTAQSGDPQLVRSGLQVDGDIIEGIFIRLAATEGTAPNLFWSHSNGGGAGFSAGRRKTSSYNGAGEFETIYFDLSAEPEWIGKTITALRFDPPGGTGSSVQIDWIRGVSPTADSDGDGTSDFDEISGERNAQDASDLAFEFEVDDDFEGWQVVSNITNSTVSGGSFMGTSVNGDPIGQNTNLAFSGIANPVILVKLEAAQSGSTELFWGITGANNFSVARRLGRAYDIANMSQILVFELSEQALWNEEEIRRLRIDPISKPTTDFSIDWVRGSDGDYDNDGIPDTAEASLNLSVIDPNDALLDPDGDGQNNLAEYIAGTNQNNSLDLFSFDSCSWDNAQFSGTLKGKANRTYRLLSWTGVEGEPWLEVPTSSIGPLMVDSTITLTDSIASESRQFYRAEVTLP